MILVSFNKNQTKITLASFLRDNYVQLPDGYGGDRLNAAYAIGGMEMLDETLEMNFGVNIDANLEVDFSGFSSIIDILGGVEIDLTQAEAKPFEQQQRMVPEQRREPPGRRAGFGIFENPEIDSDWSHQPAAQRADIAVRGI